MQAQRAFKNIPTRVAISQVTPESPRASSSRFIRPHSLCSELQHRQLLLPALELHVNGILLLISFVSGFLLLIVLLRFTRRHCVHEQSVLWPRSSLRCESTAVCLSTVREGAFEGFLTG